MSPPGGDFEPCSDDLRTHDLRDRDPRRDDLRHSDPRIVPTEANLASSAPRETDPHQGGPDQAQGGPRLDATAPNSGCQPRSDDSRDRDSRIAPMEPHIPASAPSSATSSAGEAHTAPAAEPRSAPVDCPERDATAARLGAERRRLFLISTAVGLAAPVLPYLTGSWETAWFSLAATPLALPIRTLIFLVGFHLALAIVMLPLAYYGGYVLPREYGLGRQTRRAWAQDWLKATLLALVLGSAVGGAFLWTVVGTGPNWWWVFGAFVSVVGVALVFITPYVLVPLFFKMRPLADAETVERIHALVSRAGAPVRDVCSLDFSRRTAEANAAVIGLGRSRRVVIADTLLAEFRPSEVDAVVAHEIGHHIHRDVQRLLLANAAVIWLGLFAASRLAPLALPVLSVPSLAYVPGYPMLLFVAELYVLVLGPLLSWWSRRLESGADRFALQLTRDPPAFAAAMRRIGCQNLIELRPPRWSEVLLASHPALYRRIAVADSLATPLARFHISERKDEASRRASRGASHEAEKRHADVTISTSSSSSINTEPQA